MLSEKINNQNRIRQGNADDILWGLNQEDVWMRAIALFTILNKMIVNEEIIERIREMKSDTSFVYGNTICQIATATLDIIGEEKYDGKDFQIKSLISTYRR